MWYRQFASRASGLFSVVLATLALAATALVGCAETGGFDTRDGSIQDYGTKPEFADVRSLRIEPADLVLEIGEGSEPHRVEYRAIAMMEDGRERDVTPWTHFNTADTWAGVFKDEVFTATIVRGGVTEVRAELPEAASTTTSLTLSFVRSFYAPGAPNTSARTFEEGTGNAGRAPILLYPPPNVLIPPNLLALEFQWRPGPQNDLFELSLSGEQTTVRIYTGCNAVGNGCSIGLPADLWDVVTKAFAGREDVEVMVRGTDAATGAQVGATPPSAMSIAEEPVKGGLFYWNANSGVIERYDFGKTHQTATTFLTPQQAGALFCVGCHALSRDGRRLAVGLDMPAPSPLKVMDTATRDLLSSGAANFMAFSPDGERIIASDGNTMGLYESDTLVPIKVPLQDVGTMPDWSANSQMVVFARPTQTTPFGLGQPGISGRADIMLLAHDADKDEWFGPTMLVQSAGECNYYPAFSPDNEWVVFNRSGGESYDAPDAELWIVRAGGNSSPVKLSRANRAANLGNSWPKFSPFVQSFRGRRLMWVTFSSRRDYGLRMEGEGRAQIWMAAISPDEMGGDPSYAAFWLPFQNLQTGNHIAQWTAEVVRKPCGIDRTCPAGESCIEDLCQPDAP